MLLINNISWSRSSNSESLAYKVSVLTTPPVFHAILYSSGESNFSVTQLVNITNGAHCQQAKNMTLRLKKQSE